MYTLLSGFCFLLSLFCELLFICLFVSLNFCCARKTRINLSSPYLSCIFKKRILLSNYSYCWSSGGRADVEYEAARGGAAAVACVAWRLSKRAHVRHCWGTDTLTLIDIHASIQRMQGSRIRRHLIAYSIFMCTFAPMLPLVGRTYFLSYYYHTVAARDANRRRGWRERRAAAAGCRCRWLHAFLSL